jgi:hypothetical protein
MFSHIPLNSAVQLSTTDKQNPQNVRETKLHFRVKKNLWLEVILNYMNPSPYAYLQTISLKTKQYSRVLNS